MWGLQHMFTVIWMMGFAAIAIWMPFNGIWVSNVGAYAFVAYLGWKLNQTAERRRLENRPFTGDEFALGFIKIVTFVLVVTVLLMKLSEKWDYLLIDTRNKTVPKNMGKSNNKYGDLGCRTITLGI